MPKVASVAVLLLLAGGALGQQQVPVADLAHPLRLDHRCAELGRSYGAYRQAYAFFERRAPDAGGAGLVLAKVLVGWVGGQSGANGVGLGIEKMRLELPLAWRGDAFGLALQLVGVTTRQVITGPLSSTFFHAMHDSYPVEKTYRVPASGDVDWVQFAEPEAGSREREHKHSQPINVYAKDVPEVTGLRGSYALNLIVENARTRSRLVLAGPVLADVESWLGIERPEMRTLGLIQTLNPFQRGGVWNWFRHGWRYGGCIELRRQAEQAFDVRLSRR